MIMESEARVECCVGARVCVVWYDIVEASARGAQRRRGRNTRRARGLSGSFRVAACRFGCLGQVWKNAVGLVGGEERGG